MDRLYVNAWTKLLRAYIISKSHLEKKIVQATEAVKHPFVNVL